MSKISHYILNQVAANQLSLEEGKNMLVELEDLTAKAASCSVNESASLFPAVTDNAAPQPADPGSIPLLPVQSCFWAKGFPHPEHWHLSILLFSQVSIEADALRQAFEKIIRHHDALRLVFRKSGEAIIQTLRDTSGKLCDFTCLDLTKQPDAVRQIELEITRIQSSMNLEYGPLIGVGLFKTDEGDHLLLVVHHLVFDGSSFQILIEDLSAVYRQILTGSRIELPAKTTSIVEWANRLHEYSRSKELFQELDYWRTIDDTRVTPLPKDFSETDNRFRYSSALVNNMTEEDTRRLLSKRPFNLSVQETLLTALGMTLMEWTGSEKILLRVIGQGRDLKLGDSNLTRTSGWLSISYPVVMTLVHPLDSGECIRQIRDELRRVPGNGAGYDILRYITLTQKKDILPLTTQPEIIFNFRGKEDQGTGNNHDTQPYSLVESSLPSGFEKSPEGPREYTLDITASVKNRKLAVHIDYNKREYKEDTMQKLAALYLEKIKKIIDTES